MIKKIKILALFFVVLSFLPMTSVHAFVEEEPGSGGSGGGGTQTPPSSTSNPVYFTGSGTNRDSICLPQYSVSYAIHPDGTGHGGSVDLNFTGYSSYGPFNLIRSRPTTEGPAGIPCSASSSALIWPTDDSRENLIIYPQFGNFTNFSQYASFNSFYTPGSSVYSGASTTSNSLTLEMPYSSDGRYTLYMGGGGTFKYVNDWTSGFGFIHHGDTWTDNERGKTAIDFTLAQPGPANASINVNANSCPTATWSLSPDIKGVTKSGTGSSSDISVGVDSTTGTNFTLQINSPSSGFSVSNSDGPTPTMNVRPEETKDFTINCTNTNTDLTAALGSLPSTVNSGQFITWPATVSNTGTSAAGTSTTQVQMKYGSQGSGSYAGYSGALNDNRTTASIPANESTTPPSTLEGYALLTHSNFIYSVRACADSANGVAESNENNNCSNWKDITVLGDDIYVDPPRGCTTSPCPPTGDPAVNGGWSDWGTCTNNTQTRTCTNPPPSNGGSDCSNLDGGNSSRTCPTGVINGGWSGWGACNTNTNTQTRTCNNPTPANGGNDCSQLDGGNSSRTCPIGAIDGGWSSWGACNNGTQTRTCTNPTPSGGGAYCASENGVGATRSCSSTGTWSMWSACNVSCGGGNQYRYCLPTGSTCNPPSPSSQPCNLQACVNVPNLTVQNASPAYAILGSQNRFTATIRNTGDAATAQGFPYVFQVEAYEPDGYENTTVLSSTTTSLAAGASRTITSAAYNPANDESHSQGDMRYMLRVCADQTAYPGTGRGAINESNENDNCVSLPLSVPTSSNVPIVTISARPTAGEVNDVNPSISWSATNNPTSCYTYGLDWAVSGSKPTSSSGQSQGVLRTAKTYSYGLVCANAYGSGPVSTATVRVRPVNEPHTDGRWSAWSACVNGTQTRSCDGATENGADCSGLDGGNASRTCKQPIYTER